MTQGNGCMYVSSDEPLPLRTAAAHQKLEAQIHGVMLVGSSAYLATASYLCLLYQMRQPLICSLRVLLLLLRDRLNGRVRRQI